MQKETIRLELIDRLCLILNLINNVRSEIEQPEVVSVKPIQNAHLNTIIH